MKQAILTFVVLVFYFQAQAAWEIDSAYEMVPDTKVQRSVLYFTSRDATRTYAPVAPPFGMVSRKKYTTAHGEFFLTGWAQGAGSILYRVFEMSKDGTTLICAITSSKESSNLRIEEGVLYIEKTDYNDDNDAEWSECARVSTYPSTVPSKPQAQ